MGETPQVATITPLENAECETSGCEEANLVADVDPNGHDESRTLCPKHRAEYLNEVYNQ